MIDKIKFYENKIVDNISGWYWYEDDTGAWEGPSQDWIIHKANIDVFVSKFNSVVQLGGNLGMYPRLLANKFSKVYTFEPDPLNFHILNLNTQSNENVIKIQAALGNTVDMISIERRTMENLGMHYVSKKETSFIPQLTLDVFKFQSLDLLMIDVEGYELNVLNGSIETIKRAKPVIFVERPSIEIISLLNNLGYSLVGQSMMDGIFTC